MYFEFKSHGALVSLVVLSYKPVSYTKACTFTFLMKKLGPTKLESNNVIVSEPRGLNKCALKLAKSECSLLFKGACLRENVLPNYSNSYFLYKSYIILIIQIFI